MTLITSRGASRSHDLRHHRLSGPVRAAGPGMYGESRCSRYCLARQALLPPIAEEEAVSQRPPLPPFTDQQATTIGDLPESAKCQISGEGMAGR